MPRKTKQQLIKEVIADSKRHKNGRGAYTINYDQDVPFDVVCLYPMKSDDDTPFITFKKVIPVEKSTDIPRSEKKKMLGEMRDYIQNELGLHTVNGVITVTYGICTEEITMYDGEWTHEKDLEDLCEEIREEDDEDEDDEDEDDDRL